MAPPNSSASTDLRSRARGSGTVARQDPDAALKDQIRKMEQQFALAMPRGVEAAQLVRDALTCLSANPKLAECDGRSVLGALMTCAQLGLRPAVLGQAWLLPMRVKGQMRAQLVVGYQGYLALAQRSADIARISARTVYEGDHLDYQFGLDERLVHKPGPARGDATHYYCVVESRSGGKYWDIISRGDAEQHRDRFAMARTREGKIVGPWVDHFDAMALKTVIIRTLKLAPRSTELVQAMQVDEGFRVDFTPTSDPGSVSWAEVDPDDTTADSGDEQPGDGVPADVTVEDPPPGVDPVTGEFDPTVEPGFGEG